MTGSATQSCPINVICPIVFIPGIMGSRLKRASDGDVVWDPGSGSWDQAKNAFELATSRAAAKRELLVGEPRASFSSDYLEVDHNSAGWKADRGWGGMLGTYQPFMNWLSRNEVTKIDGCMVRIQFVVWAYPYNWTNSNRMSAAGLGEVVAEAESAARAEAARLNRQAMKPILVTHSMGGLVSRAYTQILGNAGDVHGVIHGAMPTNGSPELYKRIRGGFEGATRSVLGRNQAEVTATAANMPGPLELAPNRVYQDVPGRRPWLRALDGMGNELWALPRADPYEEIYLNATDWYRLVDQTLLDPDGDAEAAWRAYRRQVNIARNFHAELEGSGFHPNTRMFYGTGRDTRDHVAWRPMERFAGAYPVNPVATFSSGRVNLRGSNPGNPTGPATFGRTLQMDGPRAQGDGTVQAGSGLHVPEMSVAVTDGFDHQKAYDSRDARELTRDWLVDMVKEAVA
ncbi:hypothetical protein BD293_4390 [Roseinatronobacter monicus]|uniref:Lecithin:cholesterol acyltransferase n=2 Tax=Roseinatronobacter monicus TaxID=393481 RepID=A0A543K3S6_9RHOB|nr:hypothetical protein BD293_4390 [Roseinatronobacter monicus]